MHRAPAGHPRPNRACHDADGPRGYRAVAGRISRPNSRCARHAAARSPPHWQGWVPGSCWCPTCLRKCAPRVRQATCAGLRPWRDAWRAWTCSPVPHEELLLPDACGRRSACAWCGCRSRLARMGPALEQLGAWMASGTAVDWSCAAVAICSGPRAARRQTAVACASGAPAPVGVPSWPLAHCSWSALRVIEALRAARRWNSRAAPGPRRPLRRGRSRPAVALVARRGGGQARSVASPASASRAVPVRAPAMAPCAG